jgi:long-subunit acyl-CoA synthetase (AMP-forming)
MFSFISHMNIASNLTQLAQHTKGTVDVTTDRYLGVLPFYHIVSEKSENGVVHDDFSSAMLTQPE